MRETHKVIYRPILIFFFLTILIILSGTFALSIIEGWKWLDALYMTVITITTVGFGEVHPLSKSGRIVTILILAGGLVSISIWVSTLTRVVVERELGRIFRRRRMNKDIQKLNGHVIICGAGDTGRVAIKEFVRSNQNFVVIEKNPEIITDLQETIPDLLVIEGDATKDEVLEEANIGKARGIITTLSSDTENLFVTISAKTLNRNIQIVARALDEDTQSKLYQVGADHVISPNIIEGIRMASVILRPTVVSFLEVMTLGEDIDLFLEEVPILEKAKLVNKTLAEVKIPQKIGLIVIAIRKKEGRFLYNPISSTALEKGDFLIVLGKPSQIDRLKQYVYKGKIE